MPPPAVSVAVEVVPVETTCVPAPFPVSVPLLARVSVTLPVVVVAELSSRLFVSLITRLPDVVAAVSSLSVVLTFIPPLAVKKPFAAVTNAPAPLAVIAPPVPAISVTESPPAVTSPRMVSVLVPPERSETFPSPAAFVPAITSVTVSVVDARKSMLPPPVWASVTVRPALVSSIPMSPIVVTI